MPEPPMVEEPMPVEPEEPGMPPMMPGEEESGMPPMMPGEEESGMPPMMPGDDMGMMSMPAPPPVNPMEGLFEEITCDENGDCFVFSCDDETGVCINAATMEVIEDP